MNSSTTSVRPSSARRSNLKSAFPGFSMDFGPNLYGRLVDLACSSVSRSIDRHLTHMESLSRARSLPAVLTQQQKFLQTMWQDQQETLSAVGSVFREAFGRPPASKAPAEVRTPVRAEADKGKRAASATATTTTNTTTTKAASKPATVLPERSKNKPVFEIYRDKSGEYRFRLRGADERVLLKSEGYKSRKNALNGVASVRKNAPNAARYQPQMASSGKAHFNLKAGNHQVIASSSLFASEKEMEKTIELVQTLAKASELIDLTAAA